MIFYREFITVTVKIDTIKINIDIVIDTGVVAATLLIMIKLTAIFH